MARTKDLVHQLVDRLAPNQLDAVAALLEVMLDPVARSIAAAPVEDEEILPETAAELDAAHAAIVRGEGLSHQEILREFRSKPR